MWDEVFDLAINNGIFAVLFLFLLIFQLKDSKNREIKYQKTIETLGKSLEVINDVKEDVEEIKESLNNLQINKKGKNNAEENKD